MLMGPLPPTAAACLRYKIYVTSCKPRDADRTYRQCWRDDLTRLVRPPRNNDPWRCFSWGDVCACSGTCGAPRGTRRLSPSPGRRGGAASRHPCQAPLLSAALSHPLPHSPLFPSASFRSRHSLNVHRPLPAPSFCSPCSSHQ